MIRITKQASSGTIRGALHPCTQPSHWTSTLKQPIFLIIGLFTVLLLGGCAAQYQTEPMFPEDAAPAITSAAQFDSIDSGAESYKRKTMKLAGRIHSVDATEQGALILADWLPFPKDIGLEEGPPDTPDAQGRRFVFLFPGTVRDPFIPGPGYDPKAAWEGNRFVLEGTVEGKKTMVLDIFGGEKSLLYLSARCIHVWETGEGEIADQPDSQWGGTIARTFCAMK